jgi:NADPH:quinone reductase-like Zn-dependent oxidoreductase
VRAATIRDGEVGVSDHPDPEPGAGEVLVRVRAAGLNGADMLQRRGGYPAPPDAPADIPGLELAGEVVAAGPRALRFREGDRVMGIVGGGGQAELCAVHERGLMPVPEGLDWPAAGGLPEVFTTAHDALPSRAACAQGSGCSSTARPGAWDGGRAARGAHGRARDGDGAELRPP